MKSRIIGFVQDAQGDWVAHLACGHRQHVRHAPPWRTRPWVLTAEGRRGKVGAELECPECGPGETPPSGPLSKTKTKAETKSERGRR